MDLRKVKKLIELLQESELSEMEITEEGSSIRLSRATSIPVNFVKQPLGSSAHSGPESIEIDSVPGVAQPKVEVNGTTIDSPMVGTFFDSASPDVDPYVTIGSEVNLGDTLCIIEAMKTFNQIESEASGIVKAIYKTSGDPVEFGESLFLID